MGEEGVRRGVYRLEGGGGHKPMAVSYTHLTLPTRR